MMNISRKGAAKSCHSAALASPRASEGFQRQLLMGETRERRRVSNASCSWGKPPSVGGFPTPVAHGGNPHRAASPLGRRLMGETPIAQRLPLGEDRWGKPPSRSVSPWEKTALAPP